MTKQRTTAMFDENGNYIWPELSDEEKQKTKEIVDIYLNAPPLEDIAKTMDKFKKWLHGDLENSDG